MRQFEASRKVGHPTTLNAFFLTSFAPLFPQVSRQRVHQFVKDWIRKLRAKRDFTVFDRTAPTVQRIVRGWLVRVKQYPESKKPLMPHSLHRPPLMRVML